MKKAGPVKPNPYQRIFDLIERRKRELILATPAPGCPGCIERRIHSKAETRKYHPFSGHGFSREQGGTWTLPGLDPNPKKETITNATMERRRRANGKA